MIEILIALLGTVALLVTSVSLYRGEREARQKRLIIGTNALALAIIWVQFAQQYRDGNEDESRHLQIVAQNQELMTQNGELSRKLDPILAAAQAKHPGISESEALAKLLVELQRLSPQLEQLSTDRNRPLSKEEVALRHEAYTQAILAVHYWKNVYMGLNRDVAEKSSSSEYKNIWVRLRSEAVPRFSSENWARYRPMFEAELTLLSDRLQDVLTAYADVIPPDARTLIGRTRTQLESSRSVYYWAGRGAGNDEIFQTIFASTMRALEAVDAEFQRLRESLPRK